MSIFSIYRHHRTLPCIWFVGNMACPPLERLQACREAWTVLTNSFVPTESNDPGTASEGLRGNEHDGIGRPDEKARRRSDAARDGVAEIRREAGR